LFENSNELKTAFLALINFKKVLIKLTERSVVILSSKLYIVPDYGIFLGYVAGLKIQKNNF
jgi:hypothetical protein